MATKTKNDYYPGALPPQKLPDSMKGKAWREASVDAVIGATADTSEFGRGGKESMQENYDIVNSIFSLDDFSFLTDPNNAKELVGNMPTKLRNHNIIRAKLELLKGEEGKRPFNWQVVGEDGEIINEANEALYSAVLEQLQAMLAQAMGKSVESVPLEQVEEQHKTKYVNIREKNIGLLLKKIFRDQNLKMKFSEGFNHATISAREFYYTGKHKSKPICRVVNPMYLGYDKNPDVRFIQDGLLAGEERWMDSASIVDEYGKWLTEDNVAKIDSRLVGSWSIAHNSYTNYVPDPEDFLRRYPTGNTNSTNNRIQVYDVAWKSLKRIGFLSGPDENGEIQESMVDGEFRLTPEMKEAGFTLSYEWDIEVWRGTRIGTDIYVDIRPLEVQTGKLPYVGYIYNNVNSRVTSLVDLVKEVQFTYLEVQYKLMMEIAKSKGKKMAYDVAALPQTGPNGMSMDRWLYYFDVLGIAFFNSMEEGREGDSTTRSTFNQFTSIDMTLSQSVQQYISILEMLERKVGDILGVSEQREGAIANSETVGGVERSVAQSSLITEPFFLEHNEVKKCVLQQLMEIALVCLLEENSPTQLIVDDSFREMLKLDPELLNDSTYKIHISDSTEDNALLQKLKDLAQVALQTQTAELSDIITIHKTQSISVVAAAIKQGEERRRKMVEDQQKAEQEQAQAQMESQERMQKEEQAFIAHENELDRQNKLAVAALSGQNKVQGNSFNQSGGNDVIEQGKLMLAESEAANKHQIETGKLHVDAADKAEKQRIEWEKLELEQRKLEQEIQLARQEMEHERQQNQIELRMMDKELQMKDKDIKIKEKEGQQKLQQDKQQHTQKMMLDKWKAKQSASKKASSTKKK